ncbi:hypothetical protein REPUB_Repub10bG0015900 [Reevesia pubescens]
MEIRSTFAAAITCRIHDFGVFSKQDSAEKKIVDQQHLFKEDVDKKIGNQSSFFNGVNLVWNGTMSEEGNFEINKISTPNYDFNGFGNGNGFFNEGFVINDEGKVLEDCKGIFCDGSE